MDADIRVGVHLPEFDGQVVPSKDPEFRWRYSDSMVRIISHVDIIKATTMCLEKWFLNKKHVIFLPTKEHGTTYSHRDSSADMKRGSFHMTWLNSWGDFFVGHRFGKALTVSGLAYAVGTLGFGGVSAITNVLKF